MTSKIRKDESRNEDIEDNIGVASIEGKTREDSLKMVYETRIGYGEEAISEQPLKEKRNTKTICLEDCGKPRRMERCDSCSRVI